MYFLKYFNQHLLSLLLTASCLSLCKTGTFIDLYTPDILCISDHSFLTFVSIPKELQNLCKLSLFASFMTFLAFALSFLCTIACSSIGFFSQSSICNMASSGELKVKSVHEVEPLLVRNQVGLPSFNTTSP